jgi:exopolyphosphatase/guanosine-5'-triphosphate,3'-diphosphate pyrophosphatase
MGLQDSDKLYLTLAAYLHNLGTFINNRAHHKHSEYIISSLSLFRLTAEEIKTIACIARYHRKATPQPSHYLYNSLPAENKIIIQKLSALLRIAHALDVSLKQKAKKIETKMTPKQEISIIVHTQNTFVLEKSTFKEMKTLFEEITGTRINLSVKKLS